ncbi:MAG: hypothetical protein IKX06_04105 [Clostridia bacterium]|nr:hypothetical protein [Clostridia bacterium]
MKRKLIIAVILILALLTCFAGCAPANGPHDDVNTPSAGPATATPSPSPRPRRENVAKVILLLGQSNAVGASQCTPLKKILDPDAYSRGSKGYENVRIVYFAGETTATNYNSKKIDTITSRGLFGKVRFGRSLTGDTFGPEIGIAEAFSNAYPDDTLYIVKVCRGGTSLSPSFLEGGALFEKAVEMVEGSFSVLEREGYSPEIISICWMQGENEALNPTTASNYKNDLTALVTLLRNTFDKYAPPGGIPFIDAGISSYWACHKTVNDLKKEFADGSDLNYYFSTIELGYTYDKEPAGNPDLAHFDSESEWLLGQKFLEYAMAAYEKVK